MDALIAKARKEYHSELLHRGVLAINAQGIATNADKDSVASVSIARGIADRLLAETDERIAGQTSGKAFEEITMMFIKSTFPKLQHLRPGKWEIKKLGNRSKIMHLSSKSRHKKAQLTEAQFGPVLNWASIAQSSSQTAVIEEVDVGVQQSWNIFCVGQIEVEEHLFMEWIIRALKPNGKAFIVVPDGIMNRSNDKKLRDFILEQCEIDAVISLPLNTFFTTNKKTYILALTKKAPVMVDGVPTLQRQTSPVFTYLCSEIGETRDVYRFDIDQNDLQVASDLFNMFKGAKTSFANTLNMIGDQRCKISSIDDFYNGTHWCVERWWNHEERQALGIEEESKTIGVNDFRVLLADTINTLSELDEPLAEVEKKNDEGLQFLEIPITQVFDIVRGDGKYTRSYVHEHTGEYPLYSGNTFGPFAQIDSYDYNVPALTWAIDGLAGYMMIHRSPFSATNHRGILLLKDTNIDLEYAKYTLEPIFRELKKGRQGDNGENEYTSLPPFMIQSVKFAVPVDHNGEPWLEKQKEIAAGYVTLEQTKETVVEQIANLSQVSIVPNCDEYAIEYLPLSDLFDTIKGKSKYTKKYGNLHSGPYPVYSASSQGTLTHLDTYDYDGRYMTWSTNGFAGTILILDGKFSINGDRGILVPKNGRQDLDFDYMKFTLEPIFRELAKGRKGDNGEDEFTKLYPSMLSDIMVPIPVDSKGNISLSLQKEIAQKFISVQNSQKEIIEKLDVLISKKISI